MFWKKKTPPDPSRLHPSQIKAGEVVVIEHNHSQGGIVNYALCISNDPVSKKVLIEIDWSGEGRQRYICEYSSYHFKNFHLLNLDKRKATESRKSYNIAELQAMMNRAIEDEEFEKIPGLQKQIDDLLRKT